MYSVSGNTYPRFSSSFVLSPNQDDWLHEVDPYKGKIKHHQSSRVCSNNQRTKLAKRKIEYTDRDFNAKKIEKIERYKLVEYKDLIIQDDFYGGLLVEKLDLIPEWSEVEVNNIREHILLSALKVLTESDTKRKVESDFQEWYNKQEVLDWIKASSHGEKNNPFSFVNCCQSLPVNPDNVLNELESLGFCVL